METIVYAILLIVGILIFIFGVYLLHTIIKLVQQEGFWIPAVLLIGGFGLFGVIFSAGKIINVLIKI